MSRNAKIVALLTARPGRGAELEALLFNLADASRAEPGALRWDVWRDAADPDKFVLDELYVDADALADHRQTPHFQAYLSHINDLAERAALVLQPAKVA